MEDDPDDIPPSPPQKLSKTPSWIMLGFVLGALFFWALPRPKPTAVAPVVTTSEKTPAKAVAAPRMAAIEAIFGEWGRFAVWENDVTEVGLWNSDVNSYADLFEVIRVSGNYYFRSIPRFTRPLLTHGDIPTESPLQFTETDAHRQRFLKDVSDENKRSFSDALRETFVGKGRPETREAPTPTVEPPPSPTGKP